ncbi:MAG: hypothetical protein HZB38_10420 [Planctomycetes bacterium]|nr:hypothetical protein [Planctomycetota bacterium]
MIGLDTLGAPLAPTGLPPPTTTPPPAAQAEPRAVESAADASLQGQQADLAFSPSRAVLQLVRRSAEDFAELLHSGQPPATAAALTGTPDTGFVGPGELVDAYA